MKVQSCLVVIGTVLLFSCGNRKQTVVETETKPDEVAYVCTDSVTYSIGIKQIFDARCVKCHSSPRPAGGIDLTTYETASKVVDYRLKCVVNWGDNCNRMPPMGGQLTKEQLDLIDCWIANGMKN